MGMGLYADRIWVGIYVVGFVGFYGGWVGGC